MKRINKFIAVLSIFSAPVLKSATLSPYWHQLPEEGKITSEKMVEDNMDSLNPFINTYVRTHIDSLEEIDKETNIEKGSGWRFYGFQTSLGLGLSGGIGVLSWGGTKVIEIDWARKNSDKSSSFEEEELSEDEGNDYVISLSNKSTRNELTEKLSPVIKSLVGSKKVKDEKELRKNLKKAGDNFFEYAKAMDHSYDTTWAPSKIRLDLSIKTSGKVAHFVVKVGADVRLRLEWVRTMYKGEEKRRGEFSESKVTTGVKKLLNKLSHDISTEMSKVERKHSPEIGSLKFASIQMGIGLGIEGKIGVASLGFEGAPSVFFKRYSTNKNVTSLPSKETLEGDIPLIVSNEIANFQYANKEGVTFEKGRRNSVFKLKRRRVKKGLKKSFKFAKKFAEKINKSASKRSTWGVKKIKSQYTFSLSGNAGPVKLKASPFFALYLVNKSIK